MKRNLPHENTARVLAVAVAFFGGLAALGHVSGVFERLGTETVIALAAFAVAYAFLTYRLDPSVRAFVDHRLPRRRAGARPAVPRREEIAR